MRKISCEACGYSVPLSDEAIDATMALVKLHASRPGEAGHPRTHVEHEVDLCTRCVRELEVAYFGAEREQHELPRALTSAP